MRKRRAEWVDVEVEPMMVIVSVAEASYPETGVSRGVLARDDGRVR